MKILFSRFLYSCVFIFALTACGGSGVDSETSSEPETEILSKALVTRIELPSNGGGLEFYTMPEADDFANIPQDINNPITVEKVALGPLLSHSLR